ncbi:MAG: hypothetical protein ACK56F_18390, partial [bacterium]
MGVFHPLRLLLGQAVAHRKIVISPAASLGVKLARVIPIGTHCSAKTHFGFTLLAQCLQLSTHKTRHSACNALRRKIGRIA